MTDLANQANGVYGARMTGGGFGGCSVNLVQTSSVDSFKETIVKGYADVTGRAPEVYVCSPAQGAERVA
jgi:galactokinase